MTSTQSSQVVRMAKRAALVIAASYSGALLGLLLYTGLHKSGFRFQRIAGDLSIYFFAGEIAAPIASMLACVLVSRYADHVGPSKLGILLSLVASYFAVDVELALLDAGKGSFVVLLFWPAIVGFYSFLGYQVGLVIVRRWRSPKQRGNAGGQAGR